jgi:2-phosphosulfolactate phosphatase
MSKKDQIDVRVRFTNDFSSNRTYGLKDYICVVIDVIRATSTIAALFGKGIKKVIIAKDRKEAIKYKKENNGYILCGEVGGHPPKGFDYGNSPLEFSKIDLAGKNAILMTTNGTISFFKAKNAKIAIALSLLNFDTVIKFLNDYLQKYDYGIMFICSGEKKEVAFDDVFVAGLAIKNLLKKPLPYSFSDSAKLALNAVLLENDNVTAIGKSCSAHSLRSVGLQRDIAFCAEMNKYEVLPVLRNKGKRLELVDIYSEQGPK